MNDTAPLLGDDNNDDGLKTRIIAADMLEQILQKNHPLDQLLERHAPLYELSSRDRGFVRMMVATTLRRLGQIDNIIYQSLDKPDDLKTPLVLNVLRLGVVQLVFLKTPPHAAVNACVEMAAQKNTLKHYKKLINAVLRRVSREGAMMLGKTTLEDNTPQWLRDVWAADWGSETAYKIMQGNATEAPLDLTIHPQADKSPESYASEMQGRVLPNGSVRLTQGGLVTQMDGFESGQWWVQDMAASIPVTLLGDIRGKKIADICAAPGGKTAQLLTAGADVLAVDRSPQRLKKLSENIDRIKDCQSDAVDVHVADASVWKPAEELDGVLIDAPCSATGTIRRHPDLPHLKKPQDVAKLADLQRRILSNAASMAKKSGIIIFCTCSMQKQEGEDQAKWFLENHPEYILLPVSADELGGCTECVSPEGYFRALPFHMAAMGGIDGFFAARFVRQ